jgi:hypothetical protein
VYPWFIERRKNMIDGTRQKLSISVSMRNAMKRPHNRPFSREPEEETLVKRECHQCVSACYGVDDGCNKKLSIFDASAIDVIETNLYCTRADRCLYFSNARSFRCQGMLTSILNSRACIGLDRYPYVSIQIQQQLLVLHG